jgi:ApaG protein
LIVFLSLRKAIHMVTQITSGIKVSVETSYQASQSNPLHAEFLFAYRITIENTADYTVQLKRRHWFIFDSTGIKTEVEGEGVVGEQPLLKPGAVYSYVSGCSLSSEIGKMHGEYLFEKTMDKSIFHVKIPAFFMEVPGKLN